MVKVKIREERIIPSGIGKKPVKVIRYVIKDVTEEELKKLQEEDKVIEVIE